MPGSALCASVGVAPAPAASSPKRERYPISFILDPHGERLSRARCELCFYLIRRRIGKICASTRDTVRHAADPNYCPVPPILSSDENLSDGHGDAGFRERPLSADCVL